MQVFRLQQTTLLCAEADRGAYLWGPKTRVFGPIAAREGGDVLVNPFATILLCSLDSLFLGVGLGALSPSRRLWLAGALGLADGLAGLFGASSGVTAPAWTAACGPTTLAVYAGGVLLAATRMRALAMHRLGIVVLPLALSLDNLVGAAACGPPSVSAPTGAAMMALASFLLAYAGCALGAALGGRWPGFARPLAAGATLAAAAAMSLA